MGIAAWLVLAALNEAVPAADPTIPRYVHFRDGSILHVAVVDEPWQVEVLRRDGVIQTQRIRPSELREVSLAPGLDFAHKRALFVAIGRLGADEYFERERAQGELAKQLPTIRPDLQLALERFGDPEIRARLRNLLGPQTTPTSVPTEQAFDEMTGSEVLWGSIGDKGLTILLDGQRYQLTRKDVLYLQSEAPDLALPGGAGTRGVRRLPAEQFPRGCIEEGFEAAPDGHRLLVGENIERLFIPKGFLLSTSVRTSHVSVNEFMVHGKSKGFSVATHQPLFSGEITVTFIKPGQEHIKAGVTHFGCWMAWIEPNGTSLIAYDRRGREIGRIMTTRQGHEFLGMVSPVPIHQVRVVPNPKVDPDYTLDDFLFSPPQLADAARPDRVVAQFRDGEQVYCRDVHFGMDGVRLVGLPAGLPERVRPLNDLVRVIPPDGGKDQETPAGVYVELLDGSVLFGTKSAKGGPEFARAAHVLGEPEKITALWNTDKVRENWPFETQARYPQLGVMNATKKSEWRTVHAVRLTAREVQWSTTEGTDPAASHVSYFETGPVLLRPSAESAAGSWHVRTRLGEDLVLGDGMAPPVSGQVSHGLMVVWQGRQIRLAPEEIVSVYRLPPEK